MIFGFGVILVVGLACAAWQAYQRSFNPYDKTFV